MKTLRLSPVRIARSLVTILLLTLVQVGIAPFLAESAHAYTQGTVTNGTTYGGTGGNPTATNLNCTNSAVVAIGTTKSGSNLNTFMFVCKTINNDATLSASEATTNVMGTPAESDRCATGQIGIGIRAIASNGGTLIGGVGLICGNIMSQGSQDTRSIMPDALSAGTVYTYICPTGQLLAGFYLRTGALVDQITPKCSTFTNFAYAAVGAPTATVTGNTASVSFATVSGSIADTALTYTVSAVPNTGSTITVTGSSSPISVPGLVLRANYTITVTASNTYGSAAATSNTTASVALPGGETDTALGPGASAMNYASLNLSGTEIVKPASGDAFTVEAWVQPTDTCTASNCAILGREENYLLTWEAGELRFIVYNSTAWGTWQYTGVNLPLNQWSHVALTKSSSTWNLYVNGALVYTASLTYVPKTSSTYLFYVGNRNGGAYPFKGYIDEVKMWRSTRSASEIATDMNRTVTNDTNLYAYWNFNEATGTTAYNQVPGATADTDLTMYASDLWNSDSIMTRATSGAYTLVTFKRSILNLVGGWKSPAGITRVSVVLVGGGGGGGGGLNGGGGGAGGFIETTTSITQSSYYQINVGAGGVGSQTQTYAASAPSNGTNSTALSLTATGGGYGGSEYYSPNTHYAPAAGGSGGGASWGGNSANYTGGNGTTGQGNKGGNNVSNCCYGAGGGGANAAGDNTTSSGPGAGGAGKPSLILGSTLAGGGGGSNRGPSNNTVGTGGTGGAGGGGAGSSSGTAKPNTTGGAQSGSANTGGGGGAGVIANGNSDGRGAQGGSGVVAIRWITASKPTYTSPTISYHNVGMTETFTTNVAQDSATVSLTRTFRWESSTTGVNGTYSVIKQGTGANNASFAWVPTSTSTSGSTFAYRVVITDSDTMGLFIVDTSTPVWAIINPALSVTGNATIGKGINLAKNETFTITLGTPTYRATLSPDAPGISLDTSTAGFAVIKVADSMTVGTYYETLTVTDSVSASVRIPLTIQVVAPPTFLNTGEIESNDLLLHLDAGNSESLILGDTQTATSITWRDLSGNGKHAQTSGTYESGGYAKTCAAGTWTPNNGGAVVFNGTSTCYMSPYIGSQLDLDFTVETWVRVDAALSSATIVQQNYTSSPGSPAPNVNYVLGDISGTNTIKFGIYDGSVYRMASTGFTPTIGAWTHVAGTYDGSYFRLYRNGVIIETSTLYTSGLGNTLNTSGTLLGRRGSSADFFNGALGSVRIYKNALSGSQIFQNYNATKDRFITPGAVQTRFTQKYGSSQSETYTITSGYGSKSSSFTVGDRTGIDWDTRTATSLIFSIQDSLTVGTYLDTATVTDALGQSTYLPVRVTVSKADTITVTLRNPKVLTYTGLPASSLPDIGFTGLKSSDTATVTRLFSAPASGVGAPETYTALVNSSVVPTDVESYTVTLGTITFNVGALSNYEGVTYETSTIKILQADQPDLKVPAYGAYVGAPYPIVVNGGAGGGAVTESVTAGSTATGCSITSDVLTMTSTSQSYCNVLITKAQSRNYKVETMTVQIYFYALVINQPSGSGSGPTMALNGQTSVTLDPYQAPSITSLSATNISLSSGGSLTITGLGFTTSPIVVKFWRNKEVTVTSTNGTTLVIPFSAIAAAGGTTGRILVTTPNGQATSVDTLTINP